MDRFLVVGLEDGVVVLGDAAEVLLLQLERPEVACGVVGPLLTCLCDVTELRPDADLAMTLRRSRGGRQILVRLAAILSSEYLIPALLDAWTEAINLLLVQLEGFVFPLAELAFDVALASPMLGDA